LHSFLQANLFASKFEIRTAAQTLRPTILFIPQNEVCSHIYMYIYKAISNIISAILIFCYFGVSVEGAEEQAVTFCSAIQCFWAVNVVVLLGKT
jgi:hypothetical protein